MASTRVSNKGPVGRMTRGKTGFVRTQRTPLDPLLETSRRQRADAHLKHVIYRKYELAILDADEHHVDISGPGPTTNLSISYNKF